jgi:ParB family transcriptional regulator, chromosome partitioning protein
VVRQSGLGRGLSSLIPAEVEVGKAPTGATTLVDLPVSSIEPNRHQPRRDFDEEALTSLTSSVRELGVLQPVLVRPLDGDRYELIAGERRWRAAHRAGLTHVPALIRVLDDTTSLESAVVENLHRADLGPLEEAAAYQQLIEDFGLTHEQVATRVGKSRAAITNALRLFQLPPSIQKYLADGQLTAGHAKALLGTPDRSFQEHLAKRCVAQGLTVRDVEDAVRARAELEQARGESDADAPPAKGKGAARSRQRDPGLLELEELLADFLETRVAIQGGAGRGKVLIEYADVEDLERIYRRIAAGPTV